MTRTSRCDRAVTASLTSRDVIVMQPTQLAERLQFAVDAARQAGEVFGVERVERDVQAIEPCVAKRLRQGGELFGCGAPSGCLKGGGSRRTFLGTRPSVVKETDWVEQSVSLDGAAIHTAQDVSRARHALEGWALLDAAWMTARPNHTFEPDGPLTRADLAVIVAALGFVALATGIAGPNQFTPGSNLPIVMVGPMPLAGARVNERGTGSQQYPPRMLLAVLVYGYATGLFSSRQIERATYTDVAVRFLGHGWNASRRAWHRCLGDRWMPTHAVGLGFAEFF